VAENGAQEWLAATVRMVAAVLRMLQVVRARARLVMMIKIIVNKYRHEKHKLAIADR
jgi:hypothetical protein